MASNIVSSDKKCVTNGINGSSTSNDSLERDEVVTKINLTIDENNVIEGAREILKVIRPQWNSNDIKFKVCFVKKNVFFLIFYFLSLLN